MKTLITVLSLTCILGGAAASGQARDAADGTLRARPLGSSALPGWNIPRSHTSVSLILNDDGDRVGAEFSYCSGTGGDDAGCDDRRFVFPQLEVDRRTGRILHAGQPVATIGTLGIRTVGPYRLEVQLVERVADRGFDRQRISEVVVSLVTDAPR